MKNNENNEIIISSYRRGGMPWMVKQGIRVTAVSAGHDYSAQHSLTGLSLLL